MAVKRFDVGVLPGSARLDVGGCDAGKAAPVFERLGDEFGAVVAADVSGCLLSGLDEVVQNGDGLVGPDRAGLQASASRVYSSVTFRILIGRPSLVRSKR